MQGKQVCKYLGKAEEAHDRRKINEWHSRQPLIDGILEPHVPRPRERRVARGPMEYCLSNG
jgi:hypothetical protein